MFSESANPQRRVLLGRKRGLGLVMLKELSPAPSTGGDRGACRYICNNIFFCIIILFKHMMYFGSFSWKLVFSVEFSEFEAEMMVLNHPGTIGCNYESVALALCIQQSARIISIKPTQKCHNLTRNCNQKFTVNYSSPKLSQLNPKMYPIKPTRSDARESTDTAPDSITTNNCTVDNPG